MAESIGTRVGRIIAGSVHALIDAVENAAPEMVMEQAIREVDEVIDDVRAELGRAAANKHLASTRLMEENRKHEELGAQIELAVGQARDDLASAAIARQLDIEAQIPVLETTIADCQGKREGAGGLHRGPAGEEARDAGGGAPVRPPRARRRRRLGRRTRPPVRARRGSSGRSRRSIACCRSRRACRA